MVAVNCRFADIDPDDEVAGAVRFTIETGKQASAGDHVFDFRPHVPADARVAAGGYLCISRSHRSANYTHARLMACAYAWLSVLQISHVKGVINPLVKAIFQRNGYRLLSEQFFDGRLGLPCIAVLLDMRDLTPRVHTFISDHEAGLPDESVSYLFLSQKERPDLAGNALAVTAGRTGIDLVRPVRLSVMGRRQRVSSTPTTRACAKLATASAGRR